MRDPAENNDIEPSIGRRAPRPTTIGPSMTSMRSSRRRDRIRVLSLTCDANDGGGYPAFDCCWSRRRMWEQCGDVHRGACLLFDRPRLERAIRENWPDKRTYFGKVDYRRDGSVESVRRYVDTDRILSDGQPARRSPSTSRAIATPFLLKSDDFASPRSTSTASCSRQATTTTRASTTAARWSTWWSASASPSGRIRRA
jgi:hypothetical protein